MPRTDVIEAEGVVVEVLPNSRYRVELANGHRLLGFMGRRARSQFAGVALGDKVRLELSPYDLSAGRIVWDMQSSV
jgi:translation initiation factor IF-1